MKIVKRPPLPRLAIVGCGAAARQFCLPVMARYPRFENSVVVDNRLDQAESVATEFGMRHACTDYQRLPFEVDAAVITTPHNLHAEQSIHFLEQGKNVFVEKPLGMTESEVRQMLEAADRSGATLMVNNCRRLFPAYRKVHELLRSGDHGKVLRVDISDGSPFDWTSASSFYLRAAREAKGVFLDRGAHTVDILCWWLSGRPQVVGAQHDAYDAAEAVMDVQLSLGEIPISLKFSRLYKLENRYTIRCEKAEISGRLFDGSELQLVRDGNTETITTGERLQYHEYAWKLVENFIGVVQGRESPRFVAAEVAASISVIEEAYRQASSFESVWYELDPNIRWLRDAAKAALSSSCDSSGDRK